MHDETHNREISQMLSEALLEIPNVRGMVVAYLKNDDVRTAYCGGRILARGLVEELKDRLCMDYNNTESMIEEDENGEM